MFFLSEKETNLFIDKNKAQSTKGSYKERNKKRPKNQLA